MKTYFLRHVNKQVLINVLVDLKLLSVIEGLFTPISPALAFDDIGILYKVREDEQTGEEQQNPITDEEGQPYYHINLLLDKDLLEYVQEQIQYETDEERIQRLTNYIDNAKDYFPIDDEGNPRIPKNPQQLFWL